MRTRWIGRWTWVGAVGALWIVGGAEAAAQEEDDRLKNLQYFPEEITRDSLVQVMRGFSFALGVRCQYCHVGGDGRSLEGVEFEKDDDPDKVKARFMLRMLETLNRSMLPLMAGRDEPATQMTCKSCHRGRPKPELLSQALVRALEEDGAEAAVERYRALRENFGMSGSYDFGEWETNVVAERLAREGRTRDAIALYEMNAEFHPESPSIPAMLGQLHEELGETSEAIRHYERSLELFPGNRRVRERLEALGGG